MSATFSSSATPAQPKTSVDRTGSDGIQAIKRGDVHRIASGQVIQDIQSAVKELIENALDAGATTVEVRFKGYGAEQIEVIDNGSGIDASNYHSLALKYHTSKIHDFSDLVRVQTFGFRGEALSSLCELGRVQVITATQTQAPVGTVLDMQRDGTIGQCDKKAARQRGTTVIVSDLFHTLPVRRRELERNVKREFAKAQALLQAYALISRGVRWVVSNTVKGRKTPIMTMAASTSASYLTQNATSVFGPKASAQLVTLDLCIPLTDAHLRATTTKRMAYREDADDSEGNGEEQGEADDLVASVRVRGLVSRPSIGSGRSSSDRCFLYVNGRPWDSSKVIRAFNEVYRSFNIQQYPVIIADFAIDGGDYDVNVSPDKRTLFLHKEAEILARLKTQLEDAFTPFQLHFKLNRPPSPAQTVLPFKAVNVLADDKEADGDLDGVQQAAQSDDHRRRDTSWAGVDVGRFANGRRRALSSSSSQGYDSSNNNDGRRTRQRRISERLTVAAEEGGQGSSFASDKAGKAIASHEMDKERFSKSSSSEIMVPRDTSMSSTARRATKTFSSSLRSFAAQASTAIADSDSDADGGSVDLDQKSVTSADGEAGRAIEERNDGLLATEGDLDEAGAQEGTLFPNQRPLEEEKKDDVAADASQDDAITVVSVEGDVDVDLTQEVLESSNESGLRDSQLTAVDPISEDEEMEGGERPSASKAGRGEKQQSGGAATPGVLRNGHVSVTVAFDLDQVAQRLSLLANRCEEPSDAANHAELQQAAVEQSDATTAEAALSRCIRKSDFISLMEVIGQFNLGFIIVRRTDATAGEDDLFIIDQHAADEKSNFERLTATTKLQAQPLVMPRMLQLSPSDELVAAEHREDLATHGFELRIDEQARPGDRVKLLALPMSQRVAFGVEDLEELLHRMAEEPRGSERARGMRCSKLRAVLASRACRRSVMIGTALDSKQMQLIVVRLGALDQPWNCPHGRPTMRHLFDLTRAEPSRDKTDRAALNAQTEVNWAALG